MSSPSNDPPQPADAALDTTKQLSYWTSVPATSAGMLGGYEIVSRPDLQGSKNFFAKMRLARPPKPPKASTTANNTDNPEIADNTKNHGESREEAGDTGEDTNTKEDPTPDIRIADCGAGIGRITKAFLSTLGYKVDIVEPVKFFTDQLLADVENGEIDRERIGEVHNVGLEKWRPEDGRYWVIWNQWCLGHLTDSALVSYLERCKAGLYSSTHGVIFVKENLTGTEDDVYDELDSSVTRSDTKFRALFKAAGLKIIKTELQRGLPRGLYPVRIYALQIY